MKQVILIAVGAALIAATRAALSAYKAHKKAGDIVVDAIEAGLDSIEHNGNK